MEGSEKYPLQIERKLAQERQRKLEKEAGRYAQVHPADDGHDRQPGTVRRALRRVSAKMRRRV